MIAKKKPASRRRVSWLDIGDPTSEIEGESGLSDFLDNSGFTRVQKARVKALKPGESTVIKGIRVKMLRAARKGRK